MKRSEIREWCGRCSGFHDAEVVLRDGWPQTTWVGHHRQPTRAEALNHLGVAAGELVRILLAAGWWGEASEIVESALAINDSVEQPPRVALERIEGEE